MIKYNLNCKNCNLNFDSWFASSTEFEKLKKRKLLSCHVCNSLKIEKSLMMPSVINKISIRKDKTSSKKNVDIKKTIIEYQKFIKKNFDYVGENFTYEARSIHYDKKEKNKGIYGTASKQDLKELKEEGIDAQIVPWFEDKNN